MKRVLILSTLLFILTTKVFAWPTQAQVFVSPLKITARIQNNFYFPIVCSGQAFGKTYYGSVFNSWMNSVVIYPGFESDIFVFTNRFDPFVRGWASINCFQY